MYMYQLGVVDYNINMGPHLGLFTNKINIVIMPPN